MKTGRRRKMQKVPGEDFTLAEEEVGLLLKRTYDVCRQKHNINKRVDDAGYDPVRWAQTLIPEKSNSENIEEDVNRKELDFWINLARKVVQKRMDPAMFIRRQFDALPKGARSIPKKNLGGAQAFSAYHAGKASSRRRLSIAFSMQVSALKRELALLQSDMSVEDAAVYLLVDYNSDFGAMFRYCAALNFAKEYDEKRFTEIAKRFEVVAALQYIEDPETYDSVFGSDWIPAGFRSEAAVIYNRVYGGAK